MIIPAEYLGWYGSLRCAENFATSNESVWFRIANDFVDVLYSDGDADHYDVRLSALTQDDWNVFTGIYEVGKAMWMTDGYVLVQGPHVSRSFAKMYADQKGLKIKTLYRRITFMGQPGGIAVSVVPGSNTGDHSNFGRLDCLLVPIPKEEHARYDEVFKLAMGPTACARATTCCQALRSHLSNDEDVTTICDNKGQDLSAPYCRSWQKHAIHRYQWGREQHCIPEPNGQMTCWLGDQPKTPRPVPAECITTDASSPATSR